MLENAQHHRETVEVADTLDRLVAAKGEPVHYRPLVEAPRERCLESELDKHRVPRFVPTVHLTSEVWQPLKDLAELGLHSGEAAHRSR